MSRSISIGILSTLLAGTLLWSCSAGVTPDGPDACAEEMRYADGHCDMDCREPDPDCEPTACADCGDGFCDPGCNERANTCPADCFCGNGACDHDENDAACPGDCVTVPPTCGDGKCIFADGEHANNCPADCPTGGSCATDADCLCIETCISGSCHFANSCGDGRCSYYFGERASNCPVDCDNGCATSADPSFDPYYAAGCNYTLYCEEDASGGGSCDMITAKYCRCGDGICNDDGSGSLESSTLCPEDCFCGDRYCESSESSTTCPADCGTP